MSSTTYTISSSAAFVETFSLAPYKTGLLDGLSFAVKDNIDIAGHKTSFGSKAWRTGHQEATYNALCIEQLLSAGAHCVGKTVSDEFTYSLAGENHFFGTPINPTAPDRIPGGSSSGSASAVACGLVDFAIGTDSAGSIRVPASFCGVWGMRPTLHRISEAGVIPFMPSVSTVGAFSNSISHLDCVMRTLLSSQMGKAQHIGTVYFLEDAFSLADVDVSDAVRRYADSIATNKGLITTSISMRDIVGEDVDLNSCNTEALRLIQSSEFKNTVGGWIDTVSPDVSPNFSIAYSNLKDHNRAGIEKALKLREKIANKMQEFMGNHDLLVFPTTPTIAPLKGSLQNAESASDFYSRTMAITSLAGVARMPEISAPLTVVNKLPVGVSFAARFYQDEFLLASVKYLLSDKI